MICVGGCLQFTPRHRQREPEGPAGGREGSPTAKQARYSRGKLPGERSGDKQADIKNSEVSHNLGKEFKDKRQINISRISALERAEKCKEEIPASTLPGL